MKQVIQNIKSGELSVADVPAPSVRPGGVLVRTRASLISAGTEKMLIDLGRKSLVGKAKARPDLVKKVIDKVKTEGFMNTLRSVMGRLHSSLPLGYSAVGEVIAVGEGLEGRFRVGDRVACAGAGYANHAEFLFVPANLVVPMPEGLSWKEGACVTLGAIALQGVRVADLRLGETVGVIGLGLLGQISVQLLRASGCRVAAIDLDPSKVERARSFGAEAGGVPGTDDLEAMAKAMTDGQGLDAVIIAAATSSNDPVVLAGKLLRKKGRVSVVGAVGMDIPRTEYYMKELDLRLSCSYGPGRYDPAYEEKGHDYPYAYVRWTENRNMDSFLRLAADGDLDLASIVTHEYGIADAQQAYDLIDQGEAGNFLGILLTYPEDDAEREPDSVVAIENKAPKSGDLGVGVIGAGNFAKAVLLPALQATSGASLRAVATASGLSARDVATRFGATKAASDPQEIFDDPAIDAVMVLTRHDSHADLVSRALRAGKAVFVEKPLSIDLPGLEEIESAHAERPGIVQVGYNRRFAPLAAEMKAHLDGTAGQRLITYRVNGGAIPRDSWIQDLKSGGGRIIGEGCHFIDVMSWLIGEKPDRVFAEAVADDTLIATLRYPGGHVGSLIYVATGDGSMSKERIEAFAGGRAAVLEDWNELILHSGGREKRVKKTQDKGFRAELKAFVEAVKSGAASPIALDDSARTTRATFGILEALRTGEPQGIGA